MALVSALALVLTVATTALEADACVCYVGQELYTATDKQYGWSLAEKKPCECNEFRLGGVNMKPQIKPHEVTIGDDPRVSINKQGEIRPSIACNDTNDVSTLSGTSPCQTYTTEPYEKLYLPEPLISPMLFEFNVHSNADYVKLYLSPNQSGSDHAVYSVSLAASESYIYKRISSSWNWVQYKSGYNYIGVPIIITYDDNGHIEVQVTGMEETLMTYDFIPPIPASSWFITLYTRNSVAEWSFYKPCIHVSKK